MALSTGNVIQAAMTELEAAFQGDTNKRITLDYTAMNFIFMDGGGVKAEDLQDIADYLDALAWTGDVVVRWRAPEIVVRITAV